MSERAELAVPPQTCIITCPHQRLRHLIMNGTYTRTHCKAGLMIGVGQAAVDASGIL